MKPLIYFRLDHMIYQDKIARITQGGAANWKQMFQYEFF